MVSVLRMMHKCVHCPYGIHHVNVQNHMLSTIYKDHNNKLTVNTIQKVMLECFEIDGIPLSFYPLQNLII